MKRVPKTVVAAAAVFAMSLNMNGCVYGPPPEGDPFFSAEMNAEQNVYGPPPAFEETAETTETTETAETEEFDPAENIVSTVYGPPQYFE